MISYKALLDSFETIQITVDVQTVKYVELIK